VDIWSQAILLGGWFGLLHAFDADHLATIGGLAVRDRSLPPAGYALRWALGHAAALGLVATAVLGLDLAGVIDWTAYAEMLVCVALLVIGAQALRAVWRSLRGTVATAPETRAHAHGRAHVHFLAPWHSHGRSGRTSIAMGLLHGGAGSAAVLALLPLAHFKSGFASALYLACFSAGVALGAVGFAKLFALAARRSFAAGERLATAFQAAVGAFAIVSGLLLFLEVVHGGP
jgi:hypothetical protein